MPHGPIAGDATAERLGYWCNARLIIEETNMRLAASVRASGENDSVLKKKSHFTARHILAVERGMCTLPLFQSISQSVYLSRITTLTLDIIENCTAVYSSFSYFYQ